ncbi:LysR family transcriptional regulator [Roseibium aggregatum]|jgi:DNA-binding transcriptional LysR family regulator|uniref:Bacterial regulatory protein LysR, HTH motif:LysR substrate binding domain n=1 Tax=Roseibium aggregatum (strain ATCC 25650 / DSM 13394 / JCM 20685 / NBRC 16684 / NCIMB 2208 / IAM 12614 / B1) TaxID=384765 RepID=A0NY87_ROSAI|nr:LysR family transcriptional regulator [Roseibium aggregatum]EAV42083.1 Bacterial regulatory protein LysR, HTH motif:LysR substrate binding domain [Stappia aggregata IAM 12614] [Roseibium aggregatum IAM 12614]
MDWDKLRIFHAAAQAGSFTHAGDTLHMSQSAVSRQVSALEHDLGVPLFHRHARGLLLTEQGELLYRTANDVLMKLEAVQSSLTDSKEKPSGALRVTTTVGLGSTWLTSRIRSFIDLYPDVDLHLIFDDDELDLGMREADVAIRLRQPTQPDLIQRKLFTVHFHVYAAPEYLQRFGTPVTIDDLDKHRLITFGEQAPAYLRSMNWLETAGRVATSPRRSVLKANNIVAIKRAVQSGVGIAILPDYIIDKSSNLVPVMTDQEDKVPSFDTYFVYPSELKNTARVTAFREFLLANAEGWVF